MAPVARSDSGGRTGDRMDGDPVIPASREQPRERRATSPDDGSGAAPGRTASGDLGAVRHDLKNLLATLRYGCTLVSAKLVAGEHQEAQALLDEMRSCLDKGRALVDRLR